MRKTLQGQGFPIAGRFVDSIETLKLYQELAREALKERYPEAWSEMPGQLEEWFYWHFVE